MAIEFVAGGDDQVACGSGATIDNLTTITISAWLFVDTVAAGTNHYVFTKIQKNWGFLNDADILGTGDQCYFLHAFSGTDGLWRTPAPSYGVWHHVVVTYDNAATTNNPAIYYDGVAQTVVDNTGDPTGTADADAASNLTLGNSAGGADPFDGKVEDPRYYGRILTAEEIGVLAAGYRGPLGGEVLWLSGGDFQGVAHPDGTTLTTSHIMPDLSGNGNDGVPTNSPVARASEAPRISPWIWAMVGGVIVTTVSPAAVSAAIKTVAPTVTIGENVRLTAPWVKTSLIAQQADTTLTAPMIDTDLRGQHE
jgi:hypothetical protein